MTSERDRSGKIGPLESDPSAKQAIFVLDGGCWTVALRH